MTWTQEDQAAIDAEDAARKTDPMDLARRQALMTLAEENDRLREAAGYAAHQLEKARIWNGTEWHYNPLHPLHYRSALERLRDALRPNARLTRPTRRTGATMNETTQPAVAGPVEPTVRLEVWAMKLADTPVTSRGMLWQSNATATLREAAADLTRLRAADAALSDVAMMLKTCAWALRRGSAPELGERALELLKRHNLLGSPLRHETLDEAGAAAAALYDRWTGKA